MKSKGRREDRPGRRREAGEERREAARQRGRDGTGAAPRGPCASWLRRWPCWPRPRPQVSGTDPARPGGTDRPRPAPTPARSDPGPLGQPRPAERDRERDLDPDPEPGWAAQAGADPPPGIPSALPRSARLPAAALVRRDRILLSKESPFRASSWKWVRGRLCARQSRSKERLGVVSSTGDPVGIRWKRSL